MTKKHKFKTGDYVSVGAYDPKGLMGRFSSGKGYLVYNYRQEYGGGKDGATEWGVMFDKFGYSAWHPESGLTLIRASTPKSELSVRRKMDRDDG